MHKTLYFFPILVKTTLFFPILKALAPFPKRGVRALILYFQGSHTPFWEWGRAFRIGKNSVVFTKIGKKNKFYALNFLLSDWYTGYLLHGIVIFSEEQVDKQTKQIVNQCNNNSAVCVCLIFLSFL